jgi:serine/threonine-protein kinase
LANDFLSGYKSVGQLGVGARSTITHVIRVTTGQSFALKRVVRRSPEDDRFIEQAETEYEVASRLDHALLRKSFEIHRIRRWFKTQELLILMEHVNGGTLEDGRPTELEKVMGLFDVVATGLGAMHAAGFVHADIKPNNILLTDRGEVKIIDFGQSCPIGHKKSRIQGTPDYIAPEQLQKMPLDERTDVFNLGATLYWALTNQTFATDMVQAPAGSHRIQGVRKTPREMDPSIPATLSALVMDCCASSPGNRPTSMEQFRSRLKVARERWRKAENDRKTETKEGAGAIHTEGRVTTDE